MIIAHTDTHGSIWSAYKIQNIVIPMYQKEGFVINPVIYIQLNVLGGIFLRNFVLQRQQIWLKHHQRFLHLLSVMTVYWARVSKRVLLDIIKHNYFIKKHT